MLKEYTSKRIAAYIAIFPPILMLLYALVTYSIFFNSQNEQNNYILKLQENRLASITEKTLKTRVNTIDSFIDNEKHKQEIFKFLNSIKMHDKKGIVVFDKNGKVLYKSENNISPAFLKRLYHINGLYKDNNLLVVEAHKNKIGWKVVSFCKRDHYLKDLNKTKTELLNSTKLTLQKSLYWLVISWFILVFFSFSLAVMTLNRLSKYENKIKRSNENIIFQSRQALLGELLPMIAHQWRQPINKIASVLMRIRFELANGSPNVTTLDRQAQQIEDSVELMSNTIDDFRTFYRPKEEPEYVDIALLIRKAIYFLDELLERKKIKIKNDLSPVKVKLHANEFLQVIINLIKNASDAVSEKGQISVTLRELKGGVVEIRVEDNGTGIPQDKLEKIFEPHESTKQGSMGLGLYMSKLIIESHFGGLIKAYNTPRGAGFLIRLPKDGI